MKLYDNIYIPGLRWFAFSQSGLDPVNADKYPAIICNSIIYQYEYVRNKMNA